jgi:23S rRNA pseudouridine1911/1915/1917 synthase
VNGAELDILYEDNHLLVIHKPAGLLSQSAVRGDDNVVARVERYLVARYAKPGRAFVGLVHRLDRNTSGVLVLARTSKAAERLTTAIRDRRFAKRYLAVVHGHPEPSGHLRHELVSDEDGSRVVTTGSGKPCDLSFTRLAARGDYALLGVELGSGRKHQIRVQCAAAGFPLVGDRRYGRRVDASLIGRPALHAVRVELPHPTRPERLVFEAPLPSDFSSLCGSLGLQVTAP